MLTCRLENVLRIWPRAAPLYTPRRRWILAGRIPHLSCYCDSMVFFIINKKNTLHAYNMMTSWGAAQAFRVNVYFLGVPSKVANQPVFMQRAVWHLRFFSFGEDKYVGAWTLGSKKMRAVLCVLLMYMRTRRLPQLRTPKLHTCCQHTPPPLWNSGILIFFPHGAAELGEREFLNIKV